MEKEDDFFPWTDGEIGKEFRISFDEWSRKNETEFQKTVETLRGVFLQKGLILPLDWIEVYFNRYLENHAEELENVSFEKFHELMKDRKIILDWANEINEELFPVTLPAEQSEKLINLPHTLCVLDQLGIIELINNKFNYKGYSGKSSGTDKAKLIASILGIEDPEKIREKLKNKDYLSAIAQSRAKETLKNHGLIID